LDQGALDMMRAQIQQAIMLATGMVTGPDGGAAPAPTPSGDGNVSPSNGGAAPLPGVSPIEGELVNKIVSRAYGARFAQRRNPDEDK